MAQDPQGPCFTIAPRISAPLVLGSSSVSDRLLSGPTVARGHTTPPCFTTATQPKLTCRHSGGYRPGHAQNLVAGHPFRPCLPLTAPTRPVCAPLSNHCSQPPPPPRLALVAEAQSRRTERHRGSHWESLPSGTTELSPLTGPTSCPRYCQRPRTSAWSTVTLAPIRCTSTAAAASASPVHPPPSFRTPRRARPPLQRGIPWCGAP